MRFRRYKKLELNSADWGRVEASLRVYIDTAPKSASPKAMASIRRTLDKVERINETGPYTLQWPDGPTLREKQQAYNRLARSKK